MNCIILGLNSDIARHIAQRLITDGHTVAGTVRSSCDFSNNDSIDKAVGLIAMPWDLLVCAVGSLMPIGKFASVHPNDWAQCVQINALGPLRMFNHLIPHRRPGASAVFFSGTNPQKTNPLYSAYSSSKALLTTAVQEIDSELTDCKVFTLAPGFVRTKIHLVHDVSLRKDGVTHDTIYACLKHLISRPKIEVGGKKIYVPQWAEVWGSD